MSAFLGQSRIRLLMWSNCCNSNQWLPQHPQLINLRYFLAIHWWTIFLSCADQRLFHRLRRRHGRKLAQAGTLPGHPGRDHHGWGSAPALQSISLHLNSHRGLPEKKADSWWVYDELYEGTAVEQQQFNNHYLLCWWLVDQVTAPIDSFVVLTSANTRSWLWQDF